MGIEEFRPTKADIELLLISPEAAPLTVGQLMRPRARDEWRVPDMPTVRNLNGEEFTDQQWIHKWGIGDEYASHVVLTLKGLELLAEVLIRENAAQVYLLQIQVGRRELNERDYTESRVDRTLSSLKALGSPRYEELVKAWETELVKAEREGKEFTWEDVIGEEDAVPAEFGAQEAEKFEEQDSLWLAGPRVETKVAKLDRIVCEMPAETPSKEPS